MTDSINASVLFKQNYQADAEIIVNQGGTGSGKTYSILLALFTHACEFPGQIITVVGQDMPNLKSGALRDAQKIYTASNALKSTVSLYNRTDKIFEFHNESIIEFRSYADAQDAKSGKRDYLFVNEANGISWSIYLELALRTRKRIYIDFNPNIPFWVHENLIGKPGVKLIISDHRHNPFLPEKQRQSIESLKTTNEDLWRVYARGMTGNITGLIFTNWQVCEEIPADARLIGAGLDFGFTNDETGCLVVYKQSGMLWIDEVLYETGLTNPDISHRLTKAGLSRNTEIIADSAEPKSIEELRRLGWKITGAKKGPDSIKVSIDLLKRYPLRVTRRSINLRTELEKYKWRSDRNGKSLNEPTDSQNHLIDPLRYIALSKLNTQRTAGVKSRLPAISQPASSDFAILNLLR